MVKKIIACLLLNCINLISADIVPFVWVYHEPIAKFRIYTGAVPHVEENLWVIPADQRSAAVPVPDNYYAFITAVNSMGLESEPSPAIQYKPVTMELVIQQSKNLHEWGGRVGVFVFRVPDTLVGQTPQRLTMTKTHVEVRTYGRVFQVAVPTNVGKKFFRSLITTP